MIRAPFIVEGVVIGLIGAVIPLAGMYVLYTLSLIHIFMSYTTIPWEEAKFEAHENYTDIQYIIEGQETMTYAPVEDLTVKTPYNPEKDVVIFDNSNPGLKVVVKAGEYMIFNPWDGHKPKAAAGEPSPIKKVVVKICEK